MTGACAWTLVGIGVALLLLVMVFTTLRWSRWRRRRTKDEKQRSDQKTREAFDQQGPD